MLRILSNKDKFKGIGGCSHREQPPTYWFCFIEAKTSP